MDPTATSQHEQSLLPAKTTVYYTLGKLTVKVAIRPYTANL